MVQKNKKKAKKPEKSKAGPPYTVSQDEYNDLLSQVDDFSMDVLQEELLAAARYGDIDVLCAILNPNNTQLSPALVNCRDSASGSTPLHMAAANGHADIVRELLGTNQCNHEKNKSGNTPLHWAAANGHEAVVELLLSQVKDIDVLQKNDFGKSALTEGFTSQKEEVVKFLLEHDSASEEKLLQGSTPVDPPVEEGEEKQDVEAGQKVAKKSSIVHDFCFLPPSKDDSSALRIRELPIDHADDPFGQKPENDTTGFGIWAASLVMAHWMAESADRFDGKTLLELGAGCGVPGLAAAFYSDASRVYLTDLNPQTVENLQYNVDLNKQHTSKGSNQPWLDRLEVSAVDWDDVETWPSQKIDYVVGCDLIYQASIVPMLKKVVLGLCQREGSFLYAAPSIDSTIGRDGLEAFIESMTTTPGCELVQEIVAPQEYHRNPLESGDDDECFLHFHELSSCKYKLYEFKFVSTEG